MNNSARRTLDMLELLAEADGGMTVSEIGKSMGIPKSSAFDIIEVLRERNFVRFENEKLKTYTLGLSSYRVGMSYFNHTDLFAVTRPVMTELMKQAGNTVYLAAEENGMVVYLDMVESAAPIRFACRIGSKNHMHLTGLGKAILAGYPGSTVRRLLSEPLVIRTEATIDSLDGLMRELETVRSRGYAVDNGEDNEMIRCLAAPLRGADGSVIAAISVSMLKTEFTAEHIETTVTRLTEAALSISHQMGFAGKSLY